MAKYCLEPPLAQGPRPCQGAWLLIAYKLTRPLKDPVKHGLRQAFGEGILLTGVVGTNDVVGPQIKFATMAKLRRGFGHPTHLAKPTQ